MAGFINSKQTISMYLRNNLMTLTTLHPSPKEIEVVIKEDNLFAVPQKNSMQEVFHFLLLIMFELKNVKVCKSRHTYHWRILGREDETLFRNTVRAALLELAEHHPEASLPKINASFLMNPGGDKFVHFLWRLTTFLLEKSIKSHSVGVVRCTHDVDDSLQDVKTQMFPALADEETRKYIENQEDAAKLKEMAQDVAKELTTEIRSIIVQWNEARAQLERVTADARLSEEARGHLKTDHDEMVSRWTLATDKMAAEVDAMMRRAEDCARQVRRDTAVVRAAVTSHVSPVKLNGAELRVNVPEAVLQMPGCEGLSEKLYVNNKLDLSALMTVGNKTVELLSDDVHTEVIAYVTERLQDLESMKQEAEEWNAYFSRVEPTMTAISVASREKSEAFYTDWASKHQEEIKQHLEQFPFLSRTDPTIPETPLSNTKLAAFDITPDPNRLNGLIKGSVKVNTAQSGNAKTPIASTTLSMNSTLNSTLNRSTYANSTYRPKFKTGIRSLIERAQNNSKLNTTHANEQSFRIGHSSRLVFSEEPTPVSTSEQSIDLLAGGDVHTSPAENLTGGLNKEIPSTVLNVDKCSFFANGLFDTDKRVPGKPTPNSNTVTNIFREHSSVVEETVEYDCKDEANQSPFNAKDDDFTSPASNTIANGTLKRISPTSSDEYSFLANGLFDISEVSNPDSNVVRENNLVVKESIISNCEVETKSSVSNETPQLKASSPLADRSLYKSVFVMGLRRNSMKQSPFPTVPEDSPLSDADISNKTCSPPFPLQSDCSRSTDQSCLDTTSLSPIASEGTPQFSVNNTFDPMCNTPSYGDNDMLSESEIVHFSLVLSPPGATEDVFAPSQSVNIRSTPADIPSSSTPVNTAVSSQPRAVHFTPVSSTAQPTPSRRGRPSLDAIIARYQRFKERMVITSSPTAEK